MINSIKKRCKIIPHFCPFCYTATLFRPVKSAPKITYIPDVLAKIGQNGTKFRVLYVKNTPAQRKYTTDGCDGFD